MVEQQPNQEENRQTDNINIEQSQQKDNTLEREPQMEMDPSIKKEWGSLRAGLEQFFDSMGIEKKESQEKRVGENDPQQLKRIKAELESLFDKQETLGKQCEELKKNIEEDTRQFTKLSNDYRGNAQQMKELQKTCHDLEKNIIDEQINKWNL